MAYETSNSTGRTSGSGLGDDTLRASEDLSSDAAAAAAEVKAAASNLGYEAARRAEQVRASAAERLDGVASAVHAGGERAASAAHRAGDALASGAQYVRATEFADMADDVLDLVRNNPGPALLCAAALGFVLGRALYRN
jgi:ElaB/YqjD/DUF883 family membrane-anchored ribosome-binding protein